MKFVIPADRPTLDRSKRIVLAAPRGYCAGVVRAVEVVRAAVRKFGPPIYVRGQIVHNAHVVAELEDAGAVFVASEDEVPANAVCVFSAHGVSPAVRRRAAARRLRVIDATCPLVAKVHVEARRFAAMGRTILLIGHEDHDEIAGTRGEAPDVTVVVPESADVSALGLPPDAPVAYLTQTTLSVDDTRDVIQRAREYFSNIVGPGREDVCYASQNRQAAVKAIAPDSDLILVVGSPNSSNANRLLEVGRKEGVPTFLVPDERSLDPEALLNVHTVGLTAGASTPDVLVERLIHRLRDFGFLKLETRSVVEESVIFPLPAEVATEAQ